MKSCFCFFTDGKQHKVRKLDMITSHHECDCHDYCITCSYDVAGFDERVWTIRRVREFNVQYTLYSYYN